MLQSGQNKRQRERSLSLSEIMTILVHFHQSHYRDIKAYYCQYIHRHLRSVLTKRAILESIVDQKKDFSQIEHSRHRSLVNFFVNVLCGLIAYCHQPRKPSLGLDRYIFAIGLPRIHAKVNIPA